MKKIEKHLKKDLDDNKEAINSIVDAYVSALQLFQSTEEKRISDSNLNIQKAMTNLANADAEDVINEIYQNLCSIDDASDNLAKIDQIRGFLFEEIQERKVVTGLKK